MADKKISELDPIAGADTAINDLFAIVDVSESPADANKHITRAELPAMLTQQSIIDPTLIGTTTAGSAAAGDIVVNGGIFLGGSAAANNLDDYEEGTWTPTVEFGGASVGITYSTRNGVYTKVGNLVTATCYFVLSNKGSSTGDATISGLPFTSSATTDQVTGGTVRPNRVSFADNITCFVNVSTTSVDISECTNAGTSTSIDDTNFANDSSIMATVNYRV